MKVKIKKVKIDRIEKHLNSLEHIQTDLKKGIPPIEAVNGVDFKRVLP